jgi:hypothetical protein
MKGAEKQIKWAEDIIRDMRNIDASDIKHGIVAKIRSSANPAEAKASLRLASPISDETILAEAAKAEDALIAAHDDAAWWIEQRYALIPMVVAAFFC